MHSKTPILVKQFMKSYKRISASSLEAKYPRIYNQILLLHPPLSSGKVTESLYKFINEMSSGGRCKVCDDDTKFQTYNTGYRIYCSKKCSSRCPELIAKKEATMTEKYGAPYALQTDHLKSKIRDTMIERHGVPYAMQSTELKEKYQNNFIEKHGVHHPSMVDEFYQNGRDVMIEKYNAPYAMQSEELKSKHLQSLQSTYGDHVTTPFKSEEVKEKFRNTCIERYGVDYPAKIDEIFNKVRATNIKRYGCPLPLQNPEIMQKMQNTNTNLYGFPHATQNPEIMQKMRETNETAGHWMDRNLKTDFELYYAQVTKYTNKQDISLLQNHEHRGRAGIEGAFHLDHKVSIRYGFINHIPPYIIGHINNLEMLPWYDNIYKSYNCSIHPEQLIESITET